MSDLENFQENMDSALSFNLEKNIIEDINLDSNIIPETIHSDDGEIKHMEKSFEGDLSFIGQDVQSIEKLIKTSEPLESELSTENIISDNVEDSQCSKEEYVHSTEKTQNHNNLEINSSDIMDKFETEILNTETTIENFIPECANQENELKLSVDHNRNIFYESPISNLSETDNDMEIEVNDNISCDSSFNTKDNSVTIEDSSTIRKSKDVSSAESASHSPKDSQIVHDTENEKTQNLQYNNELTESESFVDILGNGLLTKKIITRGLGRETRPTHGDSVTIQYKGWNTNGDLIDNNESSFVLGDGDMIQAFDLGICLAERHEEFELKTDARFAFGNYGWEPLVKPNEALTYRIKLLRVDDPPEYATFTHQDRLIAADVKRERGNYLYRREEYSLAVNSYSRAIKIIETDPDYKRISTDPSKADMFDIFVKVTNNLAAAQLKLESYDNVLETCNTILSYDSCNVKALFRKGKSLTMKGNYDDAIPILKHALELENSKLIASELQRCYQLKRAEDEQRARVCRKMFGTGSKDITDKERTNVSASPGWKKTVFKYSPYIGAVIITGVSVMLASIAIAKSKGN